AAVMGAGRADREQFVATARQKHGVVAHVPAHHATIGNVAHGHAAREIRPFRLGLLGRHDVRNRRSLSPYESAPRRRMGHERTTNSFDLFRFPVRTYLARRRAYCVGSATYRSRVGFVWGTISLQRARRDWQAVHFSSMRRAIKAEGRGSCRALRRLTWCWANRLRSPFRPFRRRPASAGGAAPFFAPSRPQPPSAPTSPRPPPRPAPPPAPPLPGPRSP